MKARKSTLIIIQLICLVFMSLLYYLKGSFNWISNVVIDPLLIFNLFANIAIGFIISFISFESGVKAEQEREIAEKAETNTIHKIVEQLAGDKHAVILSSKSEQQLSSLPNEKNDKTKFSLDEIQLNFDELLKTSKVQKVKKNIYSYRIGPNERIIFSKEKGVFIIHEIITRK